MFVSSWIKRQNQKGIRIRRHERIPHKIKIDLHSKHLYIHCSSFCHKYKYNFNFVFSSHNSTHPILDAWEPCKIRHCRLYSWADIPSHRPRCRPCYSSWWSWEVPNRDQYNQPSIPGHESSHKSLLQTPKTTRCVWILMRFTNPWMIREGEKNIVSGSLFCLQNAILRHRNNVYKTFRFWPSGVMESNTTLLQ